MDFGYKLKTIGLNTATTLFIICNSLNVKQLRPHRQPLAWLLLLIMLGWQAGCVQYQRYPMSKARMPKIDTQDLTFYLVDNAHPLSRIWYVERYLIAEKSMTATLTILSAAESAQVMLVRNNREARNKKNEVLLYAQPAYAAQLADTLTTRIDFDQLEKIEVYEANFGQTLVLSIPLLIGASLALTIIAIAAKGSCPFVYAHNPDGTRLQGELYSGSTYPQLERHDWLPLPDLIPNGGDYQVRLANKAKEIQHTNLLELLAIDHPAGVDVLVDKSGQLQTLQAPESPQQAVDFEGKDALPALGNQDSLYWHGDPGNQRARANEGVELVFRKPAAAKSAKLAIRAKNTFWMDYMYGLFLDEFGEYSDFVRNQYLKKSAADIRRWMDEQNVPLTVSVQNADGQWQKAGYFHLAGPMAMKKDILVLDVAATSGDKLHVRLESGFMFWEIDWVAIDFTENTPVTVHTLLPATAPTLDGRDVAASLALDDALYYSQPNLGEEAMVHYPVPPQASGTVRSLLLHAKGHYQILRDPVAGKPNLLYLHHFEQPDALPDYSRFRWQEVMQPAPASPL